MYDLEINKQTPVAHLLARGEKYIESGKEGIVRHVIRNPIETRHKNVGVCITLIEFSDGTKWAGSNSGQEGNCLWERNLTRISPGTSKTDSLQIRLRVYYYVFFLLSIACCATRDLK
jgi:hypothetical protein